MASITRGQFWAVARRPRWIAALLLCLGIAAGFAGLGQWQLSRSIDNAQAEDAPEAPKADATETPAADDAAPTKES